jgi:triphosphatase
MVWVISGFAKWNAPQLPPLCDSSFTIAGDFRPPNSWSAGWICHEQHVRLGMNETTQAKVHGVMGKREGRTELASQQFEIELKLELNSADATKLRGFLRKLLKRGNTQALDSVYFDTAEQHLRKAGFSLRVRHAGKRRVQTLKASGETTAGLFTRPEWERDIEGDVPALDHEAALLQQSIPELALADLRTVFRTVVRRDLFEAIDRDDCIEVSVDQGEVRTGRRKWPLCEMEFELKRGAPTSLFKLAREINAVVPVRLGVQSKAELGYALAHSSKVQAVKADAVHLVTDMTSAKALQAIAQSCIRHFRLNETILLKHDDAAALHQTRVALRRLRSALTLFKPMLVDDRYETLRHDVKWMATALGMARNIDVLIAGLESQPVPKALRAARRHAYAQARTTVGSPRWRNLMLELIEWLCIGSWLTQPKDPSLCSEPISHRAVHILDRSMRRLRRRGRHLAHLDDHARHRVRIEAKKLRYAAEFFETLPGKAAKNRRKAFGRSIETLLDSLGALNDLTLFPALSEELGLRQQEKPSKRKRKRLLKKAERQYKTLLKITPFWQ